MGIGIHEKTDYSFLFSSMGSASSGVSSSNFLMDYASIKNGSYFKLMKAYYSQDSGSDSVNSVVKNSEKTKASKSLTTAESKAYAKVQSASDALKDSADALLETGSKSLFKEKDITTTDENGVKNTKKGYDVDSIYKAVNSFVNNYNSVLSAASDVNDTSVSNRVNSMQNTTKSNAKLLSQIGITINEDNTLSIDKDAFMKADMNTVKSLFNSRGSYGYSVSASASMINYNAGYAASRQNTYTANGTYNGLYGSGNLFSSYL